VVCFPLVSTNSQVRNWILLFVVRVSSGNARVPGDVAAIPPGHDAWVVGDEPVVVIDISGMKEYAKPAVRKIIKKTRKVNRKKRR